MSVETKQEKRPALHISPMTEAEQIKVHEVYEKVKHMIDIRNLTYREFNDRTLVQYIDDSQKRLNSYVPTRGAQGKDEWQSNVSLPTIRDKIKRLIAGYSLHVPDSEVKSFKNTGDVDVASIDRGSIAKELIKASYLENENPIIENFWEAWEAAANGTCIKYEGYLKTTFKQKFIKSYDLESGVIEFDEREVDVDDKMISYLMPLSELFISDFYIHDVQEQPALAWIKYLSPEHFEKEFGRYHNADKVKVGGLGQDVSTFYKQDHWGRTDRAGRSKIEVIRFYSNITDEYIIIANGILLLNAPLLWTYNGRKVYPFAKSILEPFASKHFFYGKSFPDIMTGQYDLLNTYFNSIVDKGFRNLNVPTLIGRMNQDMFDLEDEYLSTDTKIYVEDVNQVKPMPVDQVSQADVGMIQLLAKGIEDAAPSMPHLLQGKEATAREVVITEERMKELKSIYSEMLVDLWRQKYQLRLSNIMATYPVSRKVYKDGKIQNVYKTFVMENTFLDKDTKERGILALQFRKLTKEEKHQAEIDMAAEREAMRVKGINYRKMILNPEYFDSYLYKIVIIPESLHRSSMAKMQASIMEELSSTVTFFPQVFIANQDEYFEDLARAYGRDPQKSLENMRAMQEAQQQAGGTPVEEPAEGAPAEGATPMAEPAGGDMRGTLAGKQ